MTHVVYGFNLIFYIVPIVVEGSFNISDPVDFPEEFTLGLFSCTDENCTVSLAMVTVKSSDGTYAFTTCLSESSTTNPLAIRPVSEVAPPELGPRFRLIDDGVQENTGDFVVTLENFQVSSADIVAPAPPPMDGSISVEVLNQHDDPIPDRSITLEASSGLMFAAMTDAMGIASFVNLTYPENYTVTTKDAVMNVTVELINNDEEAVAGFRINRKLLERIFSLYFSSYMYRTYRDWCNAASWQYY